MNLRKDEIFERCIAAFEAEHQDHESVSITANAKLLGRISGRSRQIDVLIEDLRFSPRAYRLVVDAKLRKRKLDIEEIESFEGKMRDVGASHGVIVVSSGVTRSAKRRAEDAIAITILDYEDAIGEYDWHFEPCLICPAPKSEIGTVLWNPHKVTGLGPGWLMYRTGKCSSCGSFHVWCGDCGSEFAIRDGRIKKCGCEEIAWGAIPESDASGHKGEPNSTWLMLRQGDSFVGLERKPIGKTKRQLNLRGKPRQEEGRGHGH